MGSHFSLIKGMTRDVEVNALVGLYWSVSGILGVDPWIEYVHSAAQLADGVSREKTDEAFDLGWIQVDTDLDTIWQIIIETIQCPGTNYMHQAHKIVRAANTIRLQNRMSPIEGAG